MPVETAPVELDAIDRRIINRLQDGMPVCDEPYLHIANELAISEADLLQRLQAMLDNKILSRFGPMFHAERLGGGLALAAMRIPEEEFDQVAAQVNQLPEIAHNYERNHEFNMWFVIATEQLDDINAVVSRIENLTGFPVYNMPKIEEYYVGLRFPV
ncbi:MAG: Lrp/AsnC family transcriptional regulator [Ketobacter sp.]|jgi:DNA-binding Lrp family transcriptional regulator|nr:MAG: Lrp/AsnC family transcriptional regulator [Ketobacter sp.]